jgi:hypothetical protein
MSGNGVICRAAVELRAADPEAITALQALRETMPDQAPRRLRRFTLWEVRMAAGTTVSRTESMLRSYEDIVNPNKHRLTLLDGGTHDLTEDDLLWVPIRVHNLDDTASEGWLSLLAAAGHPVLDLDVSVLWLAGYPRSTPRGTALEMAGELAVTRSRASGLLGNPVSQRITVGDAALRGSL